MDVKGRTSYDNEEDPHRTTFQGYEPKLYARTGRAFDEQLPDLSGAELKVLLYIIRRTFGFKKDSDNISLSQMLTGLVTAMVACSIVALGYPKDTPPAIKSLEDQNAIVTERRQSAEREMSQRATAST
jgi:hypothetical protein